MAFVSRPATDGFFVKQHPPSPSAAHCNKSPRQQHTQQQQSKQHSTVAWDRQQVQSQLIKENASLIAPRYHAASLRVSKPFLDGSLSDLGDRKLRGQQRRAPLAAETFIAPRPRHTANQADASYSDPLGDHDLVQAARRLDPSENVFERHQKKHFQWVLSLAGPAVSATDQAANKGAEGDKQRFGCNLLACSQPSGREGQLAGDPDDKYLLLATPIDLLPAQTSDPHSGFTAHKFRVLSPDALRLDMATSENLETPLTAGSSAYRPSPNSVNSAQWSNTVEPADESEPRGEAKDPLTSLDGAFEHRGHRFDDNIEAITKAAAQVSLGDEQEDAGNQNGQQSPPVAKADASARHTLTGDASSAVESDQGKAKKPAAASLRKVARPASLAPPKPIQKASKPPTVPTFELPGERVARELKEKKAARLSMQVDPQKMAEASSPQRTRSVRSSKPPTVPSFELPGERYSRMKKERLEQKLKEEEEEARRRRQFKARPSPASATPTVRSTFTSRQRQSTGGPSEDSSPITPVAGSSPRALAAKRQSMTVTASAVRAVSTASASTAASAIARGRATSIESSRVSTRATSSSAGSAMSGRKHSVASAQNNAQQDKTRPRQVPSRKLPGHEEQDRKEAIKLARQKYAEMSRMKAAQGRTRREQQQTPSSAQTEDHVPVASGSS